VRPTETLRRSLAKAGERNERSLNGEIVFRFTQSLEEENPMPTLETMRKTGPAKIEDAIKTLKDAIKAVDKIDEAIDAVDHFNGANWRKTAAGMQRCIEALESKPAAELVKETWG
jgi:hypothetical protein